MNRVTFNIVEQGTNVPIKQIVKLHNPQPHQIAFVSESFPVYPLTITVYLENPPINKFTICFVPNFAPRKITLLGSEDNQFYVKFHEVKDLPQRQQDCTVVFKQKLFFTYVRLVLEEPLKNKVNLCNQVKIGGFEFSMVTFFQTRFVCSLSAKLTYHPTLFRMLEILEYKSLLLKQNKNKLHEKYDKRLEELLNQISQKGFNKLFPEQSALQKWNQQISVFQTQPIFQQVCVDQPDPVQLKRDVFKLQKQLKAFEIDRFSNIKPQVMHYFQKYHNVDIKQGYLRQLSSNVSEDHNRALISFWSEAKQLQKITPQLEEAIIMFFNYFLQFIDSPLKAAALKIMILFDKKNTNALNQHLNTTYDRVLFNSFKYFHQTEDNELRQLSLRYCYTLYQRIDNETFLKQLLNAYKSYPLAQQMNILQILQKLTFRGVMINKKEEIVAFLIDLLMHNQLNLTEKNRAYNVAAYLASLFGKPAIMKDFEKLNSMILMTMQKNIDSKLSKIKPHEQLATEQTNSCQYCGFQSKTFRDENLYDLHKAKECKFFSNCNYCQQNIEIPELFKHYIEHCTNKHAFKHCDNCFEVIEIKQEDKHNEKCPHKLLTRCPLCYDKVDNKLKLKEHILNGCPNNPR